MAEDGAKMAVAIPWEITLWSVQDGRCGHVTPKGGQWSFRASLEQTAIVV